MPNSIPFHTPFLVGHELDHFAHVATFGDLTIAQAVTFTNNAGDGAFTQQRCPNASAVVDFHDLVMCDALQPQERGNTR